MNMILPVESNTLYSKKIVLATWTKQTLTSPEWACQLQAYKLVKLFWPQHHNKVFYSQWLPYKAQLGLDKEKY